MPRSFSFWIKYGSHTILVAGTAGAPFPEAEDRGEAAKTAGAREKGDLNRIFRAIYERTCSGGAGHARTPMVKAEPAVPEPRRTGILDSAFPEFWLSLKAAIGLSAGKKRAGALKSKA